MVKKMKNNLKFSNEKQLESSCTRSKKSFVLIFLSLMMITVFIGCKKEKEKEDPTPTSDIPESIANTPGIDKFQTAIDYSDPSHWMSVPEEISKNVDVFYLYPTSYSAEDSTVCVISDIDDAGMLSLAITYLEKQASVFEESCNIFAPYYRQVDAHYGLNLSEEVLNDLFNYTASKDPTDALDYYFEHYNGGRPFILAGHSQGSSVMRTLLSDYMKAHPDYYSRMIAAYVIGFSITTDFMAKNDHLRFAEGPDDFGVIVSWNTEGPGNIGQHNGVVQAGAISINPINWKRDDTYAPVSENLGWLNDDNVIEEGIADAKILLERGTVICESVDPTLYSVPYFDFGPQSYHGYDYGFYYMNLRKNAADRIAAYFAAKSR